MTCLIKSTEWFTTCDVRTHYAGIPGTYSLSDYSLSIQGPGDPLVNEQIPLMLARWIVYLSNLAVGRVYYITNCR